jgi:hypothetical protein
MTRSGATSVSESLLHQYASMSWHFNANQSAGIIMQNVGDKFNMFLICLICFFLICFNMFFFTKLSFGPKLGPLPSFIK